MKESTLHLAEQAGYTPRGFDRVLRRLVWHRLESLTNGYLTIDDHGNYQNFGRRGDGSPRVQLEVLDPRFYRHLVFGGSLGAAEAYIRGYWTCDDLVSLVRLFCRNPAVSNGLENGLARLLNSLPRFMHWLRRNTTSGSRRNIAAHYDLGNEFFSLFLDETMAYSCAIFPHSESSLDEASVAKFDCVCRRLALTADDQVLEIGTGWGGFAVHAARQYGCRITTTTVSQKQYEYSQQQVAAAGLSDRVTVLCEDYRELTGSFDKLVSIEMIEAVGHRYFDTYFRVCSERLKPHGMMLLQAIVIPDQRYNRYKRSVDFIQRYIFPGGCLPSIGAICQSVGQETDLRLVHLEDITPHYAKTLALWRERFCANLDQVQGLGFSEEFIRTWDFYLCYCEGAFRERAIAEVQLLLAKPGFQPGGNESQRPTA